jgi:predicted amidophosphoribosyltransferase
VTRRGGRQWRDPELCRGCRGDVESWQALCGTCWGRLPFDLRNRISAARRDRAPHLVSAAVTAAAAWLKEHSPAQLAARMLGERE